MTRGEAIVGESAEQVDLTPEQQRRLLVLDEARGVVDHYALLGVPRTADVRALRDAYFQIVHEFHPDRHFGKNLGSFAARLLRVFADFTAAYEILRKPEARADYDRYLNARERARDLERDTRLDSAPPVSGEHRAVRPSLPPQSGPSLRPSSMLPAADPEARRRALARKLGHSSAPPGRISSQPPSQSSPAIAAEELKRRYEQRLAQAREEQRNHYVALSQEAAARNDLVAAANSLRIACSLAPENLELAGDLAELERRAAVSLWEEYLERAKYAALDGNMQEAAECYERAALGQPSAALFERAAHFTLEARGDLRKAAGLAKRAVALAPNAARCRLTLAQVYAAANLRESALAELERARALEPNQPIIKEWIARVKRGDG